jgi:hypothetical protein
VVVVVQVVLQLSVSVLAVVDSLLLATQLYGGLLLVLVVVAVVALMLVLKMVDLVVVVISLG